MFISEQEARDRISSSENILNRVRRDESGPLSDADLILPTTVDPGLTEGSDEVPVLIDEAIVEAVPEDARQEVRRASVGSATLAKLLYGATPETTKNFGRGRRLNSEEHASIGLTAALLGPAAAGRMAGVSPSFAADLREGYTSTDDRYDPDKDYSRDLKRKIYEKNDVLVDLCFDRLMTTMGLMTPDMLAGVKKATDLSRIVRDLHSVVDKATPKDVQVNEQNVHFHVYRPPVLEESAYEVTKVGSGSTR